MEQLNLLGHTVQQARLEFLEKLNVGTICTVCARPAKRYKRSIHYSMAMFLIRALRENGLEPFNLQATQTAWIAEGKGWKPCGDATKFKFWDMLKDQPDHRGSYFITPKGRKFALGQIRVPKSVFEYDNIREKFDGDSITIRDCFDNPFDYDALMAPADFDGRPKLPDRWTEFVAETIAPDFFRRA